MAIAMDIVIIPVTTATEASIPVSMRRVILLIIYILLKYLFTSVFAFDHLLAPVTGFAVAIVIVNTSIANVVAANIPVAKCCLRSSSIISFRTTTLLLKSFMTAPLYLAVAIVNAITPVAIVIAANTPVSM